MPVAWFLVRSPSVLSLHKVPAHCVLSSLFSVRAGTDKDISAISAFPYKDVSPIRLVPTLMTQFNYLHKGPMSKYRHTEG